MGINDRQMKTLLSKIVEDCNCKENGYCTLLELELCSHKDPRMLIQWKCIEKFKYILSEKAGQEISMNDSAKKWIEDGYAARFGDIYVPSDDYSVYDINKLFHSILKI